MALRITSRIHCLIAAVFCLTLFTLICLFLEVFFDNTILGRHIFDVKAKDDLRFLYPDPGDTTETDVIKRHPLCPHRQLRSFKYYSYPVVTPRRWRNPMHMTNVNFTRFSIVRPKRSYAICDELELTIEARNGYGEPKTHGGDFFRAKLFTLNETFSAGTSTDGEIVDNGDGTYSAFFTLKWKGIVKINVTLVASSETVYVMNGLRETAQPRQSFQGLFRKVSNGDTIEETTRCNYQPLGSQSTSCNLTKMASNVPWYCNKPKTPKLSCADWKATMLEPTLDDITTKSILGERASTAMKRFPGVISGSHSHVFVRDQSEDVILNEIDHLPLCGPDDAQIVPWVGGFFLNETWYPPTCKVQRYSEEEMKTCLSGWNFYTFGDSTIRQFYGKLARALLGKDVFKGMKAQLVEKNDKYVPEFNIHIHFGFHQVPIVHGLWHNISHLRLIANEIDAISSNERAVVVISVWAHFQSFSGWFYRDRIRSIAEAGQRLAERNPHAVVIFRSANTQFMKRFEQHCHNNDWFARENDKIMRQILKDNPKVRLLDAWDMSKAQLTIDDIHPKNPFNDNILQLVVSQVCSPGP